MVLKLTEVCTEVEGRRANVGAALRRFDVPRCDSDQADKRKVIYPTPVTAPFKDANHFKIYVKFAEQERSRSTTNLADKNVRGAPQT